jgi:hypothetical protein
MTNWTGDAQIDFPVWMRSVYGEVSCPIASSAGACLGDGDFENVGISGAMDYGDSGRDGNVVFWVTLKGNGPRRGARRSIVREWRAYPDTTKVTNDLVAIYDELRKG